MPLNIVEFPAAPECRGNQWYVADAEKLATLTALVLVGRSQHVERILQGAETRAAVVMPALKARIRAQLFPEQGVAPWHRDALLFEIICWIVARMRAESNEVISDPHLQSTQQGVDTLKLEFDMEGQTVRRAVICEQKCSEHPRDKFRDEIKPAFESWMAGERDNQLVQIAIGLVKPFGLTDAQHLAIYDRLVHVRPLAFEAALTVTPEVFDTANCVALFKDFKEVTPNIHDRFGHTLPLQEIRPWFAAFAEKVWQQIEATDV